VSSEETKELVEILRRGALTAQDPDSPPEIRSSDSADDYLIALASVTRSILVSGDSDLLSLSGQLPVLSPADFLTMIERSEPNRT
jgi:predicted nucleic acid-binding protein